MAVRAVRGATQVEVDEREHMLERVAERAEVTVETDLPRADVTHVYLPGPANLRRDLSRLKSVPDA